MSWFKTAEGKEALYEASLHPEFLQVLSELGKDHLVGLQARMLESNYKNPNAAQDLLLLRAELEGARSMLKSIMTPLSESKK
jgi:hypothetical protein